MGLYSSINRKSISEDHVIIYGRMMGINLLPLLMVIPFAGLCLPVILDLLSITVNARHFYIATAIITTVLYSPVTSFCCRYKLEIENRIVTFRITYLGYTTTHIVVPLEKVTVEDVQIPDVIPTLYYHGWSELTEDNLVFSIDPWSVGDDIVIFYKQKELSLSADQRKFENQLWETIVSAFKDIYKLDTRSRIV